MKNPDNQNIIGNYIKARRKELKLSQINVADHTQINLKQISKIENGWLIPTHEDLKRIAEFLQFSLTALYILYEYGQEMKIKVEIINEVIETDEKLDQYFLDTIRLAKKYLKTN